MAVSTELKGRILAATQRVPSPTRAMRRARTRIVVAASALGALVVLFALGGPNLGVRPVTFALVTIVGWSAIATAAARFAFGRGRSTLGRVRSWLAAVVVATPAALFCWMLVWNAVFPETMATTPGRPGLRCMTFTIAAAVVPLVSLSIVRRERDAVHASLTGAARGVVTGALVGIVVHLWCPIADPGHIALGHVAPLLLLAAVGGLLGWRYSAVRLDPR